MNFMRRAQAKLAPKTVKPSPRQAAKKAGTGGLGRNISRKAPAALGMNSKNPMPQARPAPAVARKAVAPKAAASNQKNAFNQSAKANVAASNQKNAANKAMGASLGAFNQKSAANTAMANAATASRRANATQKPKPMPGMAKGGLAKKGKK